MKAHAPPGRADGPAVGPHATRAQSWVLRFAVAAILFTAAACAVAEESPDPFIWRPPAVLPAPEAVLDEGEYARRRDDLLIGVDLEVLAKKARPAAGIEFTDVKAGSSAERFGVVVGDTWLGIDGHPVRSHEDVVALRQKGVAQTMTIWSGKDGRRDLAFAAGSMGINYAPAWYPAYGYLASAGRGAAWDRDMVVAGLAWRHDPALTLTALAHAQAAGYAGPYLRPLQACACLGLGRSDDALAVGEAGLTALPLLEREVLIHTVYSAAIREGKLREARAVRDDVHQDTSGFAPYLADHAARLARHAAFADPLAIAATTPRYDLVDMTHATNLNDGSDQGQALRDAAGGVQPISFDCPDERWTALELAPPAVGWLSYDLTFDATFSDSTGHLTCYIGEPREPLSSSNDGKFDTMACSIGVDGNHTMIVGLQGLADAWTPLPLSRSAGRHHLLIALRDDQAGFALDGQRQGVVPLLGGSTGRSLYLLVTGGRATVHDIAIAAHDAVPPSGWTERGDPNHKVVEEPGKGANGF